MTENHSVCPELVMSQAGDRDLSVAVDVRGDVCRVSVNAIALSVAVELVVLGVPPDRLDPAMSSVVSVCFMPL